VVRDPAVIEAYLGKRWLRDTSRRASQHPSPSRGGAGVGGDQLGGDPC
jgi:hypothetical protein